MCKQADILKLPGGSRVNKNAIVSYFQDGNVAVIKLIGNQVEVVCSGPAEATAVIDMLDDRFGLEVDGEE